MSSVINIEKREDVTVKELTAEAYNKMHGYVQNLILVKWPLLKATVYRLSCCEILIH